WYERIEVTNLEIPKSVEAIAVSDRANRTIAAGQCNRSATDGRAIGRGYLSANHSLRRSRRPNCERAIERHGRYSSGVSFKQHTLEVQWTGSAITSYYIELELQERPGAGERSGTRSADL